MSQQESPIKIVWGEPIKTHLNLHPSLQKVSAFAKMKGLLSQQQRINPDDWSGVLEGVSDRVPGRIKRPGEFIEDLRTALDVRRAGTLPESGVIARIIALDNEKRSTHALVMRYGEKSSSAGNDGSRQYMAQGIALAVNNDLEGGVSIEYSVELFIWSTQSQQGRYRDLDWEQRLQEAVKYAVPVDSDLHKYIDGYDKFVKAEPNYDKFSPFGRPGYTRLLDWTGRI